MNKGVVMKQKSQSLKYAIMILEQIMMWSRSEVDTDQTDEMIDCEVWVFEVFCAMFVVVSNIVAQ
jgi:hypothetical protein